MISFRFHVVSITAIFLAIAIGVVVGSTYVDGAVVDGLRNRINTVEDNLDDRRAENDRLEGELGSVHTYVEGSDEFAVTDRLTDVPVLLIATRGIDEGSVEQIALLSRRAGGTMPGVVWLEPRFGLQGDDDRALLAEILDADADEAAEDLWSTAWLGVVDEVRDDEVNEGPESTTTTTTTLPDGTTVPETTTTERPAPEAVLLGALEDGGFLSIDTLDDASTLADLAGADPSMLLVTGSRAREELRPMLPTVVNAGVRGGLPVVVADVYVEAPEAPGRGEVLAELLSRELRDAIVLVDAADRPEGRVASVLALDAAVDGLIGVHFGYGDGADGVLPEWTPP